MKALSEFFTEQRSVMTNFYPLTAEAVANNTKDGLTWSEINACLIQHGLDISLVVHDPTRKLFNTYYADFDRRLYGHIPLNRQALHDGIPLFIAAARSEDEIAPELTAKDWRMFYSKRVPLPMYIYDFQRRYRDIQPEVVFSVWYDIYGMTGDSIERWPPEILDYIFSKAPVPELPELDKDGLITIYRGMEKMTDALKSVIIWDTSPKRALLTATHLNIDINIAVARVRPEQVIAYGFDYAENDVIVRPGAITECCFPHTFMEIEAYIENEVKKYRTQVRRQKHSRRGVNLDAIERSMRKHLCNCENEIYRVIGYSNYSQCRFFIDLSRDKLHAIDDMEF